MFKSLVLVLFVCFIVIKFFKWLWNRNRRNKLINQIPGPAGYPIIGNLFGFLTTPEDVWHFLRHLANSYSPLYKLWCCHVPVVYLVCPEDIEMVLSTTKHSSKSKIYYFLNPWLGTGLLTSKGAKWSTRRKILTPTFHFDILQQFVSIFVEESQRLIEELHSECDKEFTNILPFVTEFTLNSICETALGTRLEKTDKNAQQYVKTIFRLGELVIRRLMRPWYYFDFVYSLSSDYREQKKLNEIAHNFSKSLIEEREINFKGLSVFNNKTFKSKMRLAMLDLLISVKNSGQAIDDEGIREEVDTFMFEGHDTTTSCISFTLLLLACHYDVQEKVVQELNEILGASNSPPSIQDLQSLHYLELVIKESLRMYPSVPTISRVTDEDIQTFTGYTIPVDTIIEVQIYDLHHNPKYYPEPHKFDPERFLPENTLTRHPFSYIPFSGGPRNCIGQKFALLEIKTVLSMILRKYILEPVDTPSDLTMSVHLVLKSKNGIKIKFRERPKMPDRLYSPHTVFIRQSGHSYEIATALCSLLIGLNYDAYVVSGYATQDVCLKIMMRINSPFPPQKAEKEEEVKVQQDLKYMLKPPKDLRSKFLLMMEQREIDKVLAEEAQIAEAERKRLEELEKPPFDELYGQRVHAWVLLLAGQRDVETSVFIEPSTGITHPLSSSLYCGIESVWNNNNYWINLQDCAGGLDHLEYDFSDVKKWEHFLIGEPLKWRETKFSEEMEEDEIKILTIMDEKHLDMPTPWSERIYIPHSILKQRFPNGVKKTWYMRTLVEQFSPYVQEDGLVTRICRYNDLDYSPTELHTIEEHYENRVDCLTKIISDCTTGIVTEYYKRGREDAVKLHMYYSGDIISTEVWRVIELYHFARHDGLSKLELDISTLTEHFIDTEDCIYYRHVDFAKRGHPPPGVLEGTRRICVKIIEKHNRNEKKPASQDIAVREFSLVEREIRIKYHYEEGKVTASTRDYTKPPLAEMADKLKFHPELTTAYQSEIGAKPPRQLKLFELLELQLDEEEKTLKHIRETEDQVTEFLKLRSLEAALPKLNISLFDMEHNKEHMHGMKEREQKEKEHREREVEDEIDYLAPYIARLDAIKRLSFTQAIQVRDWCLTEFKQMLMIRANDIQQQFDKDSAKLAQKHDWYTAVQDTLNVDDEAHYFEEINDLTFFLHTLEIRLARHRELSPYRYEALENYLKMDSRMAVLFKR